MLLITEDMRRFKLGLFIGRFQPFHKGHMHALRYALSSCDRVVIGIGSSQEHGTDDNPIPADKRERIIRAALRGSGIASRRVALMRIPDFGDNEAWFRYIMKERKGIEVVFSRTRIVRRIFAGHGIPVIAPAWHRRRTLMATRIREMMKSGKRWQDRVPRSAVREIASHEGHIIKSEGTIRAKMR